MAKRETRELESNMAQGLDYPQGERPRTGLLSINTLNLWLNKQIMEEELYNLTTNVTGLNSLEVVDNRKSSIWTITISRHDGSNATKYLKMRGYNE